MPYCTFKAYIIFLFSIKTPLNETPPFFGLISYTTLIFFLDEHACDIPDVMDCAEQKEHSQDRRMMHLEFTQITEGNLSAFVYRLFHENFSPLVGTDKGRES